MNDRELAAGELPDIQGLITTGYGQLICSRFLFLQITRLDLARKWLAQTLPDIMTSARRPPGTPKPEFALNIAFTYSGLTAMNLPPEALKMFPREFSEGMSNGERPRVLGDTGDSDPSKWDIGMPPPSSVPQQITDDDPLHIILLCYGLDDITLDKYYARLRPAIEPGGLKVLYEQDTGRISDREPFGFEDGISQPFIIGSPGACTPGEVPINAGEFVLGYRNGYDMLPPSPLIPAALDVNNVLPSPPPGMAGQKDFGRNGTYLIFRKLAQNVDGFWNYIEEQARLLGLPPGQNSKEWLGAKIVGRWPSGAPVTLAREQDAPALAQTNDFKFMDTDADGMGCPIGAHIRRANPRDSLQPNPEKSIVLSNRHRLIRRGRHYEDTRTDTWSADGKEHGLCFIAFNADIQRQFEFIQQTWLNSTKFGGLYDEKDALIGDNDDGTGHMSLPASPVRQRLCGVPRFVRVRGGGYFFMPGMRALRFLAGA